MDLASVFGETFGRSWVRRFLSVVVGPPNRFSLRCRWMTYNEVRHQSFGV